MMEKTFLALSLCFAFVYAIPAFEGVTSWSSIGSLVPGITYLEAIGPDGVGDATYHVPQYMSIQAPRGLPGNATVYRNKSPPLFYIHNNQLWHFHNESTILPVHVHNSTLTSKLPLQVVVGDRDPKLAKRTLVRGGNWRWQGTMLRYEQGDNSTPLFYSCQDTNGLLGLFLFLEPAPTPVGCSPFTMHSFNRVQYRS
ncbi:unnamed protein product [Somion occarium]|uniref:Uncharacterized protein n=2 Tax=Somion occarium TaxID=3059160 RepID=A0ABP1CZ59_9APHY